MQPKVKSRTLKAIIVVLLIIIVMLLLSRCGNGKIHALENAMESNSNISAVVNETNDAEFVEEEIPVTEAEVDVEQDVYTPVDQTVYAITGVNVRVDAGTENAKLGELAGGDSIVRVGIGSNGWSKVIYNGKEAYVSSKYLTTEPVTPNKPVTTNKPAANNGSNVGSNHSNNTPKHTHSYRDEVVKPTCTMNGYTIHRCGCGDEYIDSNVNAFGHDYVGTVVAPTYTERGYTLFTCTDCNDSYKDHYTDKLVAETKPTEPAPTEPPVVPTEPKPTEPAPTEPKPTEPAPTEPKPTEPKPTEHVHNYYVANVVKATCTSGGFTTYKCDCGDSYNGDATDPAGHAYGSEVVAPTTENGGYTLHVCSGCGDSYKDSYTDKIVVAEPEKPVNTHKHKEVTVGGWTYIYCSDVTSPWQDGNTLYYPYDMYF